MKVSMLWLKSWFCLKTIKNDQICNQLTKIGLEVESLLVEDKKICDYILVGKIVSISSFLFNDNVMNIFKIFLGHNKIITIIDKNKNNFLNLGLKVAVAIEKALIKNNIKIKKKKIGNFFSEGIFCSYIHLNLLGNFKKIIIFPKYFKSGLKVTKIFNSSKKNCTIVLNITHNRNDCLSIIGIAREICSFNNIFLKKINFFSIIPKIKNNLNYFIESSKLCKNYLGRFIKNVNTSINTPFWMLEKLRLCNIQSINIIYDIINYVSIELNQSFHIFSLNEIKKNILIRFSKINEKFCLNDKKDILIKKKILVISNKKKILSLGNGFITSKKSSINKFINSIYIGIGEFNKKEIDKVNLKYYKYNKGFDNNSRFIDKNLQNYSLEYASKLILDLCGGIPSTIKYVNKKKNIFKKITVFHKCFYKILGFNLKISIFLTILKKLSYKIFCINKKFFKVSPPTFRYDISLQEDVISDFLRIYDINTIKLIPLKNKLIISKKNKKFNNLNKLKYIFSNLGYSEVINYSFINNKWKNFFFPNRKPIRVINPISKDFLFMRNSLWNNLLKNIIYNKNRQEKTIKIFEIGDCFFKKNCFSPNFHQKTFFSGAIFGLLKQKTFFSKKKIFNFYSLKKDLEKLLKIFLEDITCLIWKNSVIQGLCCSNSAKIYLNKTKIGHLGMLDFKIQNFLNLKFPVFLFELFLDNLVVNKNKLYRSHSPFFPTIERDISLLVSKNFLVNKLCVICKNFSKKIYNVYIFDIYQGKKIPKNKKSVSIKIIFKSFKKTLKDLEIDLIIKNFLKFLNKDYAIKLRKQ
ncbi:phenylalanine--tRNA ligase subunit beta [Buchnera aphidicola]|uniref:phenylalanine--tRNA ligase subunit beta n=1 Tax=Buchnera aphidicola TaxID=9 RepID=UPI00346394CD